MTLNDLKLELNIFINNSAKFTVQIYYGRGSFRNFVNCETLKEDLTFNQGKKEKLAKLWNSKQIEKTETKQMRNGYSERHAAQRNSYLYVFSYIFHFETQLHQN